LFKKYHQSRIIVPETGTGSSHSNLALDFLTPVVEVMSKNDTLLCTFDTGAGKTWLFKNYYDKFRSLIDSTYERTSVSLGRAGMINTYEGYMIGLDVMIGGPRQTLDSEVLLPRNLNSDQKYYDGNLGQDYFGSFDEMIINFDHMFVKFRNM